MNGSNSVILVCMRPTEICNHTIAEIARDLTIIAPNRRPTFHLIRVYELVVILGV
jgi:hypothetical protein